ALEVDAGQVVFFGDLLGPQVLLHGHRVVGSTRYGRVVGGDHAQSALNQPYSRDDSRGRRLAVVHVLGGQWRDFEEGTARVQQGVDPVSGQQLASGEVALPRPLPSPREARARRSLSSATSSWWLSGACSTVVGSATVVIVCSSAWCRMALPCYPGSPPGAEELIAIN